METVLNEIKTVKEENAKLKVQVVEQDKRMEVLERQIRAKNLIIKGVADKLDEKETEAREKIQKILGKLEVDMEEVRRIGKYEEN